MNVSKWLVQTSGIAIIITLEKKIKLKTSSITIHLKCELGNQVQMH
jgi:hypothetical protein